MFKTNINVLQKHFQQEALKAMTTALKVIRIKKGFQSKQALQSVFENQSPPSRCFFLH